MRKFLKYFLNVRVKIQILFSLLYILFTGIYWGGFNTYNILRLYLSDIFFNHIKKNI